MPTKTLAVILSVAKNLFIALRFFVVLAPKDSSRMTQVQVLLGTPGVPSHEFVDPSRLAPAIGFPTRLFVNWYSGTGHCRSGFFATSRNMSARIRRRTDGLFASMCAAA